MVVDFDLMNKGFWMPQDAGCLAEENIGYENPSRIEQKRSHQWLMDTGEPGIFSNKKQAVEAVYDRPVSAVNVSQSDTGSGFHSLTGQFSDRLFGSDLIRSVNSVEKNIPSDGSGNLNMGIKDFGNQYGIDPSVGLSISSPCLNFGGIRKVKVNQVRDSDHGIPAASIGHSYSRSANNTFSIGSDYSKNDGNITSGSTYNDGSDNTVAIGISKPDENLFSTGHVFNKGDRSFMLMGHNYGKGDESVLSIDRSFDTGNGNFVTMGQTYGKEDGNLISLGTSYSKSNESFTSMGPTYGKTEETFTTVPSFDTGNSSSFVGFHVDPEPIPSGGIINSSNPLISNQNSAQGVDSQKDLTESNPDPLVNITQKHNAKNDTVVKNKEPNPTKKTTNNFPANVKSLLSTGIFDGIPIKYCTWSRERYLQGVIKGTGYLCSCDVCKGQKALNAYEFERHAGGKSKHPNNHIFFENGKSIYGVVQELKNSPKEMLFDAIQTVTGSTINLRNFRIWKASYETATRELQRIYGKDDAAIAHLWKG
ncbi:hypothetical protein TSUD_171700 [Trifolium subterraneum]|uniref:Tify domain-containing protein n=1 Tax=Trifolium subterraneum TaxID=3900 RepID=A0A2Z6LZF5_TRISU|nr:hypothetical protein TSUD_171700 [Trifolium subterraneum]